MLRKITLTIGLFFLCIIHATAQGASDKIKVVATIFPTYDFTKQIGKDRVDAVKLLPPGVEAHGFEPRPKDVVTINKADVFVYTGEYMEPWAEDILDGVTNKELAVVDSSKGIELMDEADHVGHGGHGGEHAFEWAGSFVLPAGKYVWTFAKVDGAYADPAMKMVFVSTAEKGIEAIEAQEEAAEKMLEMEDATPRGHGEMLSPNGKNAYKLTFDQNRDVTEFPIVIEEDGVYAFFTEHMPFEFEADEHFLKDSNRQDVEPVAQEPDAGDHHHHHHHHGGIDPHIWVDLAYAQQMVDTIAESLAQKDPENKNYYLTNAKEYNAKLAALDARFSETLANCKHDTIIYGGHFAFGYFAKRYNLGHESPYEGFAPNAEPSPKAIAELIDKVEASGIKVIYHEELLDPKVARTVSQETGVKLELLHGAHNVSKDELKAGVTYLDIMNENYDKLKVGLECQ